MFSARFRNIFLGRAQVHQNIVDQIKRGLESAAEIIPYLQIMPDDTVIFGPRNYAGREPVLGDTVMHEVIDHGYMLETPNMPRLAKIRYQASGEYGIAVVVGHHLDATGALMFSSAETGYRFAFFGDKFHIGTAFRALESVLELSPKTITDLLMQSGEFDYDRFHKLQPFHVDFDEFCMSATGEFLLKQIKPALIDRAYTYPPVDDLNVLDFNKIKFKDIRVDEVYRALYRFQYLKDSVKAVIRTDILHLIKRNRFIDNLSSKSPDEQAAEIGKHLSEI